VESNSNGATRPMAKDAEGDGDQRNAINPSEKRNRAPLRTRATLGPLTKLEDHVPLAWWDRQFDALYLKTDGDVVEDDDITRREIRPFLLPPRPRC
jgi:hypothetical protein